MTIFFCSPVGMERITCNTHVEAVSSHEDVSGICFSTTYKIHNMTNAFCSPVGMEKITCNANIEAFCMFTKIFQAFVCFYTLEQSRGCTHNAIYLVIFLL